MEESFHCCGETDGKLCQGFPCHTLLTHSHSPDPKGPSLGREQQAQCSQLQSLLPRLGTLPVLVEDGIASTLLCPSPLTPGPVWSTSPHPRTYKPGQLTVFCGWPNHTNAELRECHILTEATVRETEFIRAFGDSDVL